MEKETAFLTIMCYSPAEEEIRLRAYFHPAAGDMNLTKQI
jgi:hypothetical protein